MIDAGKRLGPYEILSPLGAGGMGEVYKARDTRLERTVAVKVLPQHLSASPEVRQRFEREAKTISQLSHPHICALYDVGNQDGVEYLVMEFLEGETLADRLVKGPLPTDQTLRYGIEMADALDKAHRQGIVHRDLKPGNVMLTKSGVKLLDFGLAKAMRPASSLSGVSVMPTQAAANLTAEGTILGTFQYMAPEQLEGKEADARSDLFAFGAVLYEMATGRKAFSGASQASLISAIMKEEPAPIAALQPMTPPALDRVVKTCLAKDPEDRFQTAHDARLQLQWIAEGGSQAGVPAPVVARRRSREVLAWTAAALAVLAAVAIAAFFFSRPAASQRPVRLSLPTPAKGAFEWMDAATVSPDGSRVAFVAHFSGGRSQLFIRPLDSLAAAPLPATEGARNPFWSPDGRFLGFFADGKLKKIEASGGPPQVLCEAPAPFGGTWSREGIIVFAPKELDGLFRVAATGGTPVAVTKLGPRDESHRYPSFLPDGRHFLYLADSWRTEDHWIRVGSLDSQDSESLVQAVSNPLFVFPNHLLFVRGGALLAQRLDPKRRKLEGDPAAIGEQIAEMGPNHLFEFSASAGVLLYGSRNPDSQLVWFDRQGKRLQPVGEPGRHDTIELSPDGERVLFGRLDPDGRPGNLWVLDLSRGTTSRLTSDTTSQFCPVWSADGRLVSFSSMRSGQGDLFVRPTSPAGAEQLVLQTADQKCSMSWSPDGRFLLFGNLSPKTKDDLWILPLSGDRKPTPFLQTPFRELAGQFSPDGKWVAYASDESGRSEIYLQSFSDPSLRFQVSAGGGARPRWRADGRELFYFGGGELMSVSAGMEKSLQPGNPKSLFKPPLGVDYAVSRDGQRFLIAAAVEEAPQPITVVLHWDAGLKK